MKILYAEDNDKIARLTSESLRLYGHVVELAHTYEDACFAAEQDTHDLIILDRMLPGGKDGLDLCKHLRAGGNATPILMLTALSGSDNRIHGYKTGADDYLEKPFKIKELLARMEALVRRTAQAPTIVQIGADIVVDVAGRTVTVAGQGVRLSKRVWGLLEYLLLHQGQIVSKEMLIDRVWGMDSDVLANTVEATVRQLRLRLGASGAAHIQTVHGFGYRLVL